MSKKNHSDILIIEDNLTIQKTLSAMLNQVGYATQVASDGESGLSIANTTYPDLIILDLDLPDIDGMELATMLFEHPYIIYTQSKDNKTFKACLQTGLPLSYLIKGCSKDELIRAVEVSLKSGRKLYSARRAATPSPHRVSRGRDADGPARTDRSRSVQIH